METQELERHSHRVARQFAWATWFGVLLLAIFAAGGIWDWVGRHKAAKQDVAVLNSLSIEALPAYDAPPEISQACDWVRLKGDLPQDAVAVVNVFFVFDDKRYSGRSFPVSGQDIERQTAFLIVPDVLRTSYGHAKLQVTFFYHGHQREYGDISINTGEDQ